MVFRIICRVLEKGKKTSYLKKNHLLIDLIFDASYYLDFGIKMIEKKIDKLTHCQYT